MLYGSGEDHTPQKISIEYQRIKKLLNIKLRQLVPLRLQYEKEEGKEKSIHQS